MKTHFLKVGDLLGFPNSITLPEQRTELDQKCNARQAEIESALGRLALKGEPLFKLNSGGVHRLDYIGQLNGQEARFSYFISKDDQKIDIYVTDMTSKVNTLLDISISTPGPIVGPALGDKGYRGLFFSITPGERRGNLFDVIPMLSRSVELVNHRLSLQATMSKTQQAEQEDEPSAGMSQ